jgi:hypothetical protein
MKRFVIRQYGYETLEYSRVFVLEVPDHMNEADVTALDENRMADLADKAGIDWSEGDMIGPEPDRHDVEREAQDSASEQLEVVMWSEEIE